MMKKIEKIKTYVYVTLCTLSCSLLKAQAATPQFNEKKAKETAKAWLNPIMSWALWVIPVCGIVRIAIAGIGWYQKDEQEREQNPFHRTIITYVKWTIIIEMIPVIYTIFGLSNTLKVK